LFGVGEVWAAIVRHRRVAVAGVDWRGLGSSGAFEV